MSYTLLSITMIVEHSDRTARFLSRVLVVVDGVEQVPRLAFVVERPKGPAGNRTSVLDGLH